MLTDSCGKYIGHVFSIKPSKVISRQVLLDYLFIFSLCLPIGLAPFFNTGNSLSFKPVINMMECFSIGLFFLRTGKIEIQSANFKWNKYGYVFIFWLLWGVLAVLNTNEIFFAAIRQMEWMVHILFSYVLFCFFKENLESVRYIHLMPIIGFFLVVIALVVFWFSLPDPQNFTWKKPPFFNHIRHLTYFTVAVLLLLPVGKKRAWAWFPFLTIIWGVLLWTGGRGGILSACFGIFLIVCIRRQWELLFYHAAAAFLGFQLSLCFPVNIKLLGLTSVVERTVDVPSINRAFSGRFSIWEWSIQALRGHWLLGIGPEGFRFLLKSNKWHISQPHGTWLQIFLEWGIPGGLAFIWLKFGMLRKIWQERKKIIQNDYASACFALIFSYLIFSLVDGVYYHTLPMTLLSYAYAVLFACIFRGSSEQT